MKIHSLLFISILCTGCDYGVLWQDQPYVVHWIDTSANKTLAYSLGDGSSIGRVEAEVIAVGSNEFYVIAKRKDIKSKEIQYFYVEKKKDNKYHNLNKITKGPYKHKEFIELSKTLKFPKFTKEF
jgi:hypothetical protein